MLTLTTVYGSTLLLCKENASSINAIKPTKFSYNCDRTSIDNEPPVLTATGNQIYCPGSAINIVTSMDIFDPDDTTTLAVYIQIANGYENTQDLLLLTGSHPNIGATWDAATGKLTLKSPVNVPLPYTDFIAAIEDVVYTNSAIAPSGTRTFSISIGQANYLPSTGHYYDFVPALGITWTSAKAVAETATYYGLQGYLATLTAADEAQLCGEQASGAGWIGGNDVAVEGVWRWVTGPEAGTLFWNGAVDGTTPNYAFWNNSEPNNLNSENYAHITAPGVGIPGSWNDLTNEGATTGDYQPKGYIVEYGGMPGDPVLNIATSTTLTIPFITPSTGIASCGPGSAILIATTNTGSIKWYDTPTSTTVLATGVTFTTPIISSTTTYYASAFDTNCTTATRTAIVATVNEIPVLNVIQPSPACEGTVTLQASTNIGTIQWFAEQSGGSALATTNDFVTPILTNDTTFYAVASNNGCLSGNRIAVNVTVYQKPNVQDEEQIICENDTTPLNAGIDNVTYNWFRNGETTKSITVDAPGNYSVTVTNPQGCSNVKTFTVIEKFAPIISNVVVNGTDVRIVTTTAGEFEYSVDGINYQSSPIFTVDKPGLNTAYVREINFCGSDKQEFIVIIIPLFFTPNNDGFNDVWTVPALALFPDAQVSVFDRYGKLVCELNKTNLSWNGTYNGLGLPSTDYWYVIKLDPISPTMRGHFSLVR